MIDPRVASGLRDLPPAVMIPRERMLAAFRQTFSSFGFVPIETPHIERMEVLTGKARNLLPERSSARAEVASTGSTDQAIIDGVAFAADGGVALTVGADHQMRFWDTHAGRLIQGPRSYGDKPIPWMVLMPDEHTLVTGAPVLDGAAPKKRPGFRRAKEHLLGEFVD